MNAFARTTAVLTILLGVALSTAHGQLTVTPAGSAAGLSLTTFATGFPTADPLSNGLAGPFGIVFPSSGGVLVSDAQGNVRFFATDTDNQTAASAPIAQNYGGNFHSMGMTTLYGNIYMSTGQGLSVAQLNQNGTFNQTIVSGFNNRDVVGNPFNGHLYVTSTFDNAIYEVDPISKTKTSFAPIDGDGLALSGDGSTLYVATETGHILGFNTLTKVQVFDSGLISGVDGIVLGSGTFSGKIFANTNFGQFLEVDLLNPNDKTVLASGGSRGDFVYVDPYNGTLLITQTDSIVRASGLTFELPEVPEPTTAAGGVLTLIACGRHFARRSQGRRIS
jgi:hypothetical protein